MTRRRETPGPRWTIDAYETDGGEEPAWSFIRQLEGRDKVEAIALVKLLEEQGSLLRRPQSGALGEGLFELRGKQVRLFYMFLPKYLIVLLDGEIKKRDDVPPRTLARMRALRAQVVSRGAAHRTRGVKR
jgi:hypothetical protein